MSKAASQVNSDQFAQTNAFKEAASKMNQATQTMAENLSTSLSTNASANTGMTLDSRQSVNLDRFSDSIRNKNFSDDDVRNFARKNGLDENAFMDKFNSYNDTFKASTQLGSQLQRTDALVATTRDFSEQKIAIDTARGETAESNKQDLRETSSLLKGLVADFGGNAQQMLPITNQLDRITGDASGINTIAQAQERTPDHVDTSGVMSADRVADVGQGLDAQAKAGLAQNQQNANQHIGGQTESGVTPYNVGSVSKEDIQGIHKGNVANSYSEENQSVLSSLDKNTPVVTNETVGRIQGAGQDVKNANQTFDQLQTGIGGKHATSGMGNTSEKLNSMYGDSQIRGISNNLPNYFDRVANDPTKKPDDKRAELAAQAVFTYGASTMATGAEKEQLKADTQSLLTELGHYNVSWGMNDLQSIHEGFNMHNKASGSLDSAIRANLGEGGSGGGIVGQRTQTTIDTLAGNKIESNTERSVIGSTLLSGQESVARGLDVIGAKPVNDMLSGIGVLTTPASLANDATNPVNMPSSLLGKVGNHLQMSDGLSAVTSRYKDMGSDGIKTYESASQNSERAIRQQLTDDPRFGSDKADAFVNFMKSDLNNTNEPYQSRIERAENWLNDNKK